MIARIQCCKLTMFTVKRKYVAQLNSETYSNSLKTVVVVLSRKGIQLHQSLPAPIFIRRNALLVLVSAKNWQIIMKIIMPMVFSNH